jgi:transposase
MAAGLVPIVVHSGTKTPPGKLPVYGNRELRCAFYFPVVVSCSHKIGVWPFMQRLGVKPEKSKMTVIVAGMRKLAHIVYGVLTSGLPFDPNKLGHRN